MARFEGEQPSMGKSLELLGLASFNVLIALVLSVTFLSRGGGKIDHLTEANVTSFVQEMSDISGGKRPEMDPYSVTSYFMDHIAPEGKFKTTLRYSIPEMEDSEREMEMDKMNFISHTLQGLQTMADRETLVKVEYVHIDDSGKSAAVTTTNYERGLMPVDDGSGEVNMMPVQGTSYCEQKIILSDKRQIQVKNATCTTELTFSEGL